jgi:putative hydrolase of the HAD superfamily
MAFHESSDTVFVLDLDDTLYPEIDYQTSGYMEVCRWLEEIAGISLLQDLASLRKRNEPDVLGALCELAALPFATKESLLWMYRLHVPKISLSAPVTAFLQVLRERYRVAILTDGRSVTQRQKIKALGLADIPVYISEEYSSEKPAPYRFELIMKEMPANRYVYVGDNLKKDFIAPNALGWLTFCLRDQGKNVHSQEVEGMDVKQMPSFWIDSLDETLGLLC